MSEEINSMQDSFQLAVALARAQTGLESINPEVCARDIAYAENHLTEFTGLHHEALAGVLRVQKTLLFAALEVRAAQKAITPEMEGMMRETVSLLGVKI